MSRLRLSCVLQTNTSRMQPKTKAAISTLKSIFLLTGPLDCQQRKLHDGQRSAQTCGMWLKTSGLWPRWVQAQEICREIVRALTCNLQMHQELTVETPVAGNHHGSGSLLIAPKAAEIYLMLGQVLA